MANEYKIYIVGNFLEIEDTTNGYFTNIRKQDAKIVRHNNSNEWYDIFDKGNTVLSKIFLTQILDENGDPYTFNSFEDFRGCNLGSLIVGWACRHEE